MKKLKYIFLLAALFALGACQSSQEERMGVLKVYNWADYIDETLCLCGFIALGVIIPHSSILRTIPVALKFFSSNFILYWS